MENVENKTNNVECTKDAMGQADKGLLLTATDAEEYYAYKKQKKVAEIMDALAHTEGVVEGMDDVQRAVERAMRLHQVSIRMTPTRLMQAREYLTRGKLGIDCWIGGNGETLTKVKVYEARLARKMGASELTLVLTPSWVESCRYAEIRKELKRIRRVAKTTCLKVWLDKQYPYSTVSHLVRLGAEVGVQYVSIPYFAGCERLRFELFGDCRLEVFGVETLADFKKMIGAGVGRIVTARGFDFYKQWMKEAEEIRYIPPKMEAIKPEKTLENPKNEERKGENMPLKSSETETRPKTEAGELKFL